MPHKEIQLKLPGDKSLSHRLLILAALATGESKFTNIPKSKDIHSTINALKKLGVQFQHDGKNQYVASKGYNSFPENIKLIDCENSGTTIRLLCGLLSSLSISTTLTGDKSLRNRPMERIITPLKKMGASIQADHDNSKLEFFPPLKIEKIKRLEGISYKLPIASAQLKSALLLAGIFSSGHTILTGKIESRDHTERLFPLFGITILTSPESIEVMYTKSIVPTNYIVPGDISSASFWIAATLLKGNCSLFLKDVLLNKYRIGLIDILKPMGANIEVEIKESDPEDRGTVKVSPSTLHGIDIPKEMIASIIDEIPILALLATQAIGITSIKGATELRYKESDRLKYIHENLKAMGASTKIFEDGITINGEQTLQPAKIETKGDHRIAMTFKISELCTNKENVYDNLECIQISYPGFLKTFKENFSND